MGSFLGDWRSWRVLKNLQKKSKDALTTSTKTSSPSQSNLCQNHPRNQLLLLPNKRLLCPVRLELLHRHLFKNQSLPRKKPRRSLQAPPPPHQEQLQELKQVSRNSRDWSESREKMKPKETIKVANKMRQKNCLADD